MGEMVWEMVRRRGTEVYETWKMVENLTKIEKEMCNNNIISLKQCHKYSTQSFTEIRNEIKTSRVSYNTEGTGSSSNRIDRRNCWKYEYMHAIPEEWNIYSYIRKEVNLRFNNYMVICVTSSMGRLYGRLENCIVEMEEQHGFRTERLCLANTFTFKQFVQWPKIWKLFSCLTIWKRRRINYL